MDKLMKAIKKAFVIHSPGRLMNERNKEYGAVIEAGIYQGLKEGQEARAKIKKLEDKHDTSAEM